MPEQKTDKTIIENKLIFITGASSGIGAACAQRFAAAGANLLLCARRIDQLNQLADELRTAYAVSIHTLCLDVRDHASIQKAFLSLPEDSQAVDILINNAGLAAGLDTIQNANVDDWEEMINTNIKGLLYVTKICLPRMLEKNGGHIINIGSISGHHVYPKGAVYCATKHAVHALSQGLRMDLLGTKIRVSSIDPGMVQTNFSVVRFKGDKERAATLYEGITPLSPEDIADAVYYAASCPPHVNISEMIIMPTDQAGVTMLAKNTK